MAVVSSNVTHVSNVGTSVLTSATRTTPGMSPFRACSAAPDYVRASTPVRSNVPILVGNAVLRLQMFDCPVVTLFLACSVSSSTISRACSVRSLFRSNFLVVSTKRQCGAPMTRINTRVERRAVGSCLVAVVPARLDVTNANPSMLHRSLKMTRGTMSWRDSTRSNELCTLDIPARRVCSVVICAASNAPQITNAHWSVKKLADKSALMHAAATTALCLARLARNHVLGIVHILRALFHVERYVPVFLATNVASGFSAVVIAVHLFAGRIAPSKPALSASATK